MESKFMPKRVVGPTEFPPKPKVTVHVTSATPQSKPVITLYVRRAESSNPEVKARTVSLHPIPDQASIDDLLSIGFGFDGDTVSVGITPKTTAVWRSRHATSSGMRALAIGMNPEALPSIEGLDDNDEPQTLAGALNQVQSVLVAWLRNLGYDVKIA